MARLLARVFFVLALACGEVPIPEPVPPVEPTLPPDDELLTARPFQVKEPTGYDGGTALPLLVALHGYGRSGTALDEQFALSRFAESRDVLLVLPNALHDARGNRSWRPASEPKFPFDREYLRAVIQSVKARYAVDPARVFVFGYSQGGHMAHRMGCDAADQVVAFVSLAGQAATQPGECLPARSISALQVHGTDDEAIGYDGDAIPPVDPRIPSAHQTIAVWGRHNGCGALVPTARTLDLSLSVAGDETTVERYAGCPPGIDVELWTMHDVQHWPFPSPNFMSLLYGFLAEHARP
ncbi:MAG: alpha/beta hydrolase fold domain-containing protein [Archangium sp.]|nr:alpha/beta hydrolase fold domain-containing protein [Archangium sp.]